MHLRRWVVFSVLLLTIAFVPTGFVAAMGPTYYAGLVYSATPNVGAQSGIFEMQVSANQRFDGQIVIGYRSANFGGQFDTNGAADIVVKIFMDTGSDLGPDVKKLWDVHFQLSPARDSISGTLHFRRGGFPDGTLSGKRSSFNYTNPFLSPGRFTFILAGSGDPANTNFPTGNGFGTMLIDSFGTVNLAGSLADRSAFSASSVLCDDNSFPMFIHLYKGNEMVQGWIQLTNSPTADLTGDVIWAKPSFVQRSFYPGGFTNEVTVVGSRYNPGNQVFGWTNGVVIFQGGNLSSPFTNAVVLNAKNAFVNVSENQLALKIRSISGRFNGWVKEPLTGDRIPFMGVVLQNENAGFGFFPDAPLSGQVSLAPAGP